MQIARRLLGWLRLLTAVSLLAGGLPVLAQLATVAGVAVNGASGKQVVEARISLCHEPESKTTLAVVTCSISYSSADGRFSFPRVKAGRFYLAFDAKGYLQDQLALDGRGESSFTLHAGETRSFRLVLWPEGSINGRVFNKNGEPVAGIGISALREDASLGRRYVSQYQYWGGPSGAATDKNGEFRIGNLRPGKYHLETYIEPSRKRETSMLKDGYNPSYYPASPTLAAATAICIGAGEERRIEFHLSPGPTHTVHGQLEVSPDLKRDFEPLWGLRRDDGEHYGQSTEEEFDRRTGAFEIRHVPPGSYNLEVQTGIYDTDLVANKSFTVADADVSNLDLELANRFSLRARVQIPEGFHPGTSYSVLFDLEADGTTGVIDTGQPITKEGDVSFSRLQPGHYSLYLLANDPVYIKSAMLGDQNALMGGLTIPGPTQQVLGISLGIAKADVSGTALGDDGAPVAGADVKLIAEGKDSPFVLKSVNADEQGHFSLRGIPPGGYNIVALNRAVRDWEFGSVEFDQLKRWATQIQVGDEPVAGLAVKAAMLRYSSPVCATP